MAIQAAGIDLQATQLVDRISSGKPGADASGGFALLLDRAARGDSPSKTIQPASDPGQQAVTMNQAEPSDAGKTESASASHVRQDETDGGQGTPKDKVKTTVGKTETQPEEPKLPGKKARKSSSEEASAENIKKPVSVAQIVVPSKNSAELKTAGNSTAKLPGDSEPKKPAENAAAQSAEPAKLAALKTEALPEADTSKAKAKSEVEGSAKTASSEARTQKEQKASDVPIVPDGTLAALAAASTVKGGDLTQPAPSQKPTDAKDDSKSSGPITDKTQAAPAQPHLTVIDLRSASGHDPVQSAPEATLQPLVQEPKHTGVEVRLVQFDATGHAALTGRSDVPAFTSRQDAANLVQQNWGTLVNQVTKNAGIVLKDNNSGEIRLVLRPESLGSVRIKLEMQDNVISGKIVVENQSVRQLFQQNLDSLYRAFQESGFNTGTLNVSVGGRDSAEREKGRYAALPGVAAASSMKSLADHIPDLVVRGESLIDLVV